RIFNLHQARLFDLFAKGLARGDGMVLEAGDRGIEELEVELHALAALPDGVPLQEADLLDAGLEPFSLLGEGLESLQRVKAVGVERVIGGDDDLLEGLVPLNVGG